MKDFNLFIMEKVSEMPYGKAIADEYKSIAYFGNMKVECTKHTLKIGDLEIPNTELAVKGLIITTHCNVGKFVLNEKEDIYKFTHPYKGDIIGYADTYWNDDITNPQKVCYIKENEMHYDFRSAINRIERALIGTDLYEEIKEVI